MNITNQLCQVSIPLAYDGFMPILKQMAMPPMTPVELYCIPCQQLPHAGRQGPLLSFTEDMKMLCEALDYVKLEQPYF